MPGKLRFTYTYAHILTCFILVEAVEKAAGLTFFSDEVKKASKHICKTTKCEVIVRRFDDAQKRPDVRRAISAPGDTGRK